MKLGLGTVQFGLAYGISNQAGQVPEAEAAQILSEAERSGIDVLDTAQAYGDAELVIGRHARESFRIVTKLAGERHESAWEGLKASLSRLKRKKIYALLLHRAADLLEANAGDLLDELKDLKSAGIVEKIGVSVYGGEEIDLAMSRHPFDLVQVPLNILDQRLLGGALAKLKAAGVEVHARSALLQGLLMMDPGALKGNLSRAAGSVKAIRERARQSGMSMLDACVGFACSRPEVDRVIAGVVSRRELEQLVAAERNAVARPAREWEAMREFALNDEQILNPSKWEKQC